jgi:hypothetical protein
MDKSKILEVNNDTKKYMLSAEEGPINRDPERIFLFRVKTPTPVKPA